MADNASPPQMLNVQIDGVWHQFPKGTRVIEACEKAGSYVPRYCYHKKLSSPGNCRMCLIEMGFPRLGPDRKPELGADGNPIINWIPRPQISASPDLADGMNAASSALGASVFARKSHTTTCSASSIAGVTPC